MKNLSVKNAVTSIFIFFILFILSESYVVAASPVVTNPISDQTAHNGEPFNMTILTYDTFSDADGETLSIVIKQTR